MDAAALLHSYDRRYDAPRARRAILAAAVHHRFHGQLWEYWGHYVLDDYRPESIGILIDSLRTGNPEQRETAAEYLREIIAAPGHRLSPPAEKARDKDPHGWERDRRAALAALRPGLPRPRRGAAGGTRRGEAGAVNLGRRFKSPS